MKKAIKLTKIFSLCVLTVVVVYDVIIGPILGLWEATVSNITYWSGLRLLFAPFAWGVLTSHFWMSKLGRKLFGIDNWRYAVWIPIGTVVLVMSIVGAKLLLSPVVWMMNDNLWVPLLAGQLVGLLWAQEKPKEMA